MTSHSGFQYGSHSGFRSGELAMSRPRSAPRLATRSISVMAASSGLFGIEARPAKRPGCVEQKSASHSL